VSNPGASVKISSGSTFYGVIYAPNSIVDLATNSNFGRTDFFGSFVGDAVLIGSAADTYVHYDVALNPAGSTNFSSLFEAIVNLLYWRYRH
jgi:hypothetical protein